ncbi:MAG: AI-2E family transporter [Balneolales bacterium]|nr:AI-2E family transporter [Balneolales bacterium]
MKNLTIERFFKGLLTLVLITLTLLLLYRFSTLVAYIAIALVFSYLFEPIVNRMQVAGFKRTNAVILVVASFILLIVWASTSIAPTIGSQVILLASQLNIDTLNTIAAQIERELIIHIPFINEGQIQEALSRVTNRIFDFGDFQDTFTNIFGIFANIFTAALIIPFATFFFLKDGSKLRRQVLELVPNKFFETTLTIINKIETRLILYFKGVLIQSTLVALISYLMLSLAGLNNALAVGVAVGLANTIPYFGPIIGYILSIIIAIFETGDFSLVPYCIGAIMVAQIVDNVVLQPMIFSKSADIHPLYILFIIMIGAELAGLVGMLLAIPTATIIRITITEINWSLKNYYVFKSEN